MAITGPFVETIVTQNPANAVYRARYEKKTWYRQKPYLGKPLTFDLIRYVLSKPYYFGGDAPNHTATGPISGAIDGLCKAQALQKAYGKFRSEVYAVSAELGTNIAERQQAVEMIATSADRLRRAWNFMRRGDFSKFLKELKVKALPKHRRHPPRRKVWDSAEGAANLWLEYHFGWDPIVKDIYSTVDLLQRDVPADVAIGRGTARNSKFASGRNMLNYDIKYRYRYLIQAEWEIVNPSLHLATSLGLTNPVATAWEVVPFSFLVDWFIPISQFLNQYTDFYGIKMIDAFTTLSQKSEGSAFFVAIDGSVSDSGNQGHCLSYRVTRSLGITVPGLPVPKQLKAPSVVRAATAISLLLAVFQPSKYAVKRPT